MGRIIFLVVFLFSGCGSDSSDDNEANNPEAADTVVVADEKRDFEVTRINLAAPCYQGLEECSATITVELTGGTDIVYTGRLLTVSISDVVSPNVCDEKSLSATSTIYYKMKLGRKYFIRACLFDKQKVAYTPGILLEHETEPKT